MRASQPGEGDPQRQAIKCIMMPIGLEGLRREGSQVGGVRRLVLLGWVWGAGVGGELIFFFKSIGF